MLQVLYLIFNEGYTGAVDLAAEAIRLTRQLVALTDEPEVAGLLALMLLHYARRASRRGADGRLVPLAEQDRSLWETATIAEAVTILQDALGRDRLGVFQAQAAIAALHADAALAAETDWTQILEWYDELTALTDSPVVALNRAVAGRRGRRSPRRTARPRRSSGRRAPARGRGRPPPRMRGRPRAGRRPVRGCRPGGPERARARPPHPAGGATAPGARQGSEPAAVGAPLGRARPPPRKWSRTVAEWPTFGSCLTTCRRGEVRRQQTELRSTHGNGEREEMPTDLRAEMDGVTLVVRAWSAQKSAGCPAAVLLPATGETAEDWDVVAAALSSSRTVYSVNLRGHGPSDWPGTYAIQLLADDVTRLLAGALSPKPVDLVGHSLGGLVACAVAASRPGAGAPAGARGRRTTAAPSGLAARETSRSAAVRLACGRTGASGDRQLRPRLGQCGRDNWHAHAGGGRRSTQSGSAGPDCRSRSPAPRRSRSHGRRWSSRPRDGA